MAKQCRGCLQSLPFDNFYTHPKMADGHLNYCRLCVKQRVRQRRQANLDQVRAYDQWRYRANKQRKQQLADWKANRTPEQRKAHNAVSNAIRDGRLLRPQSCSMCGKHCKPEAHHDDYLRPLDVRWMCRSCHCRHHMAA